MNKLKKILITLGVLILATLGYETKDQIIGGFNTMRGFTTLSGDTLNVRLVTVSSASFGELATTSVELLSRPPVGHVNQVVSVTGYRLFSSESWNNNWAGAPTIGYQASTSQGFAITASLSLGLFSGGLNSTVASSSYTVTNPAIAYSAASNSVVVLRRAITTTEPSIDGDTYFKFFIIYRVVNFP